MTASPAAPDIAFARPSPSSSPVGRISRVNVKFETGKPDITEVPRGRLTAQGAGMEYEVTQHIVDGPLRTTRQSMNKSAPEFGEFAWKKWLAVNPYAIMVARTRAIALAEGQLSAESPNGGAGPAKTSKSGDRHPPIVWTRGRCRFDPDRP